MNCPRRLSTQLRDSHLIGTLLLGLVAFHLLTSSSIQSLQLRDNLPSETVLRIYTDVGDGLVFRGSGDETQVFFLEEKRAAVERALEKEAVGAKG